MELSVIIPCYNSSHSIKKMLDSIETNFADINYEVIIVDDKSKQSEIEKTRDLVYLFDRARLLTNKGNKGAGSCRNSALAHARGKWLLFADSDDHFLKGSGKIISKYIDSDADIVLFPPVSTDDKGDIGNRHLTFNKEFENYKISNNLNDLRFRLPYVWSKLYRREFIQAHNIAFDEVMVNNDVMFSVKSGHKAENISVDSNPIYSWDYSSNSLTANVTRERFLVRTDVVVSLNTYLKNETSQEIYRTYRPSAVKLLISSLIRYKYGLFFTFRLAGHLVNNGIKIIKKTDIDRNKIRNFLKNNKMYSSEKRDAG